MTAELFNLVNLKITDYVVIVSLNAILTAVVSWWIKSRLEQSIKHEYAKKLAEYNRPISEQLETYKSVLNTFVNSQLEEYKFEIRKREQATKIVELFALVYSGVPTTSDETTYLADINRRVWELSLWLPAGIVRGLSTSLTGVKGEKDPKQTLIEIRKVLLGENDDLKAEEIVHFGKAQNYDVGREASD